ncbi:MAG: nucleotidyltransferase family protein [Anaerolineae bacterium]|nr:nucleotidyltransferase family protein [Anaerolineae bacterium]
MDKNRQLTLEDLRSRRDEILALAARHGAYNVRVFGSIARGDSTSDSDVDILVDFVDGASLYDLSGLWQDLQDLLGQPVDVVEDHPGLRERFRQRIVKDAVPL